MKNSFGYVQGGYSGYFVFEILDGCFPTKRGSIFRIGPKLFKMIWRDSEVIIGIEDK